MTTGDIADEILLLKQRVEELEKELESAKCAFADLAFSTDLKLTGLRNKAKRKYIELKNIKAIKEPNT